MEHRHTRSVRDIAATPFVTVIVPTCDRPAQLRACIEALRGQDYPKDWYEILVVNDGWACDLELGQEVEDRAPAVHLLRRKKSGPAAARNHGAAVARGQFLAFTDDDCMPQPGWLASLVAELTENPESLVGGVTENAFGHNLCAEASRVLIDYLYERYRTPEGETQFFTSNNMAVRAAAFAELDGFSTEFDFAGGEDRDFCARWIESGRPMRLVRAARVQHFHALTLRRFWGQHYRYGRGASRFHARRRQRTGEGLRVQKLEFYAGMVGFAARNLGCFRGLACCGLIGLSQVANLAGFLAEGRPARASRSKTVTSPDRS